MTDILKIIGAQFGFVKEDEDTPVVVPAEDIGTEARLLADAEIGGSMVLADRRDMLRRQTDAASQSLNAGAQSGSAVDKDGNVDFDLLFAQAGLKTDGFTADQAANIITQCEKTIPAVISDRQQRDDLLRSLLIATVTGPAAPERIVYDAKKRSDALTDLMRSRLDLAADFKQKATDTIKELEEQIAMNHAAIVSADKQFDALSSTCKDRQSQYLRVIDLFSQSETEQAKSVRK